ncbi:hypothetical protein F4809DRAFT_82318 [Biscogniauxia mediterranea]|nr:hypothetical protein F4809DRAFT_82318 [Biscogniauxia mediterranea]
MKPAAALFTFAFASCTLATPVVLLAGMDDTTTGQRNMPSSGVPEGDIGSLGAQDSDSAYPAAPDSQPDLSDQGPLSPDWDAPKPPFLESSILREETRANVAESEPEATIVEMETKAVSEAYTYVPCMSRHGTQYYQRVRKHSDVLVVAIVLSFVGVVTLIELWDPICERFRQFRSGKGAIYLEEDEESRSQAKISPSELQKLDIYTQSAAQLATSEVPSNPSMLHEKEES